MWSPTGGVGAHAYASAELGAILVNINPSYRRPRWTARSRRPGSPRCRRRPRIQDSDYAGMLEAARPHAPELQNVVLMGSPGGTPCSWSQQRQRLGRRRSARRRRREHPVHVRHHRATGAALARRNILDNGYFTAAVALHRPRSRIVVVPPLYRCFGMVIGNLAARHGCAVVLSGPGFNRGPRCAPSPERATSLYGCPPCSSRSWSCRTSRTTTSPTRAPG
ncbi:hypothetical protein QJS66_13630 [Kocuria rhizophila]|nr:hypothetical protein QJS66_13630 [Kocuria rhizophila]